MFASVVGVFGPYRSVAVVSISSFYFRGVSCLRVPEYPTYGQLPVSKDPEIIIVAKSFNFAFVVCHGR
jgi:hypothetical protein